MYLFTLPKTEITPSLGVHLWSPFEFLREFGEKNETRFFHSSHFPIRDLTDDAGARREGEEDEQEELRSGGER